MWTAVKVHMAKLTVALTGNPNSGKTTTFNNLTGTRQKVGNWPGVTVEKKLGAVSHKGVDLTVVDLPGTYSLTAFSIEEIVARNFILEEAPDLVVDIIDSSNLERSLFLATQLLDLDSPVLLVLNMSDVAKSRGQTIDAEKLSELLGVPVVSTVGNRNEGTEALLDAIVSAANKNACPDPGRRVRYTRDLEQAVETVRERLAAALSADCPFDLRWTAAKLIEHDSIVRENIEKALGENAPAVMATLDAVRERLADLFDDEPEIIMTEERYGFISGIIREVVKNSVQKKVDVSRNIDLVLTNRFLGFPIFIFFIWAMFQLTFTIGAYPQGWLESLMNLIISLAKDALPPGVGADLLTDGVLSGVGAVIVFLPNILILFFCIALFEDTGYMARAAFLMDRIMHLLGLHGKSFIPLLMGFGCNVPAIMAARTLESDRDRILTILINPLMSCSARLPVYVLLAGAFFPGRAGNVIFGIYLLGIVLAVVMGRIFSSTILKGCVAPFVMELPPYRMPMAKSLAIHMWDRAKMFLKKMGGVILVGSIIIWFLASFPKPDAPPPGTDPALAAAQAVETSFLGRMGHAVEPVFAPLGLDWKSGVALITGAVAKEVVVSTLGVLHQSDSEGGLSESLQKSGMTPLSALALMAFVLLYMPCLATVAAIRHETGSRKWTVFAVSYSTALAWLVSFGIYQGGRLLGLG